MLRPKINLLNRKIQQKKRERQKKEEGVVYLIRKTQNNKPYYVERASDTDNVVIWTADVKNAVKFHTEAGVQYYINSHLCNRNDIEPIGVRNSFV